MNNGGPIIRDNSIGVKVNSRVKEATRKIAAEENTSLSSFVENLIMQELKRRSVSISVTMTIDLLNP